MSYVDTNFGRPERTVAKGTDLQGRLLALGSHVRRKGLEARNALFYGAKKVSAQAVRSAAGSARSRQVIFNALRLRRPEIMQLRELDEIRFLSFVFDRIATSKSQILQDLWVLYELQEKKNGFFVEFGATNGLTNSNSWLLETSYGWSGILAEPNPVWHEDLMRNRNCAIDTRCVYAKSGDTVSFMAPQDAELSAIASAGVFDHYAGVRQAAPMLEVETISLNRLLELYHAPREIDFVSVDTEGSELEILEAFDFSKYKIKLMSVEHNHTENEAKIDALLARHGFKRRFVEFSQWDGWYVRSDK